MQGDRPNTAADPSKKKKSRFRRAKEEEEKTVITVCYGRRTEVLGTIEVPESASYEDVRKLVHPLVREYYGRLVQSTEDLAPQYKLTDGIDKTDAFFMTGPDGCPMSREAEQVSWDNNIISLFLNFKYFLEFNYQFNMRACMF